MIPGIAGHRHMIAVVLLLLVGMNLPLIAQSNPTPAGEIRFLVPVGSILRGTATAIPAKQSDPIYWQDTVRTEPGGRVRIGLLDGSILNVGSQASLTITKHDPASQQTQLELTYGRIRAKAVHIVQPGGSFKVRTPVAVIGVVGTKFTVKTTGDTTEVICLEDTVRVRNVEERVVGEVTLHTGEFTRVLHGKAPLPASPASPEQIRESEDETSIPTPPMNLSRVEVSWPPPGCGENLTLFVRAWSKQIQNGKEIETPVDPELIAGKLLVGAATANVEGGLATLTNAPTGNTPEGTFTPEGKQATVPVKIWPAIKIAAGQGWRTARAVFAGSSFYVLGPIGMAQQVTFTFADHPAAVLWVSPCGSGLLAPEMPGGTYPVTLSVGGKVVARGQMNLVQVSYDVPSPPVLMRGQTTKFGIELRGLAGLDPFVQGRPVEVTTLTNNTPEILGGLRSQTPGSSTHGESITYRVGAHNVDASGLARLDATGRGHERGSFNLSVANKLDEALEQPNTPLTPVHPGP